MDGSQPQGWKLSQVGVVPSPREKSEQAFFLTPKSLSLFFVLIFSLVSIPSLVLTPPFQFPDTLTHFDRTVAIAEGKIIGTMKNGVAGGVLPTSVEEFESQFDMLPFVYNHKVSSTDFQAANTDYWQSPGRFTDFGATTQRSPFVYVPGAVAVIIGRLVSGRVLVSYYLVEIANLATFLVLCWWSLKRVPVSLGLLLSAILFLPMVQGAAASVNPDGILVALAVVFAASIYCEVERTLCPIPNIGQQRELNKSSKFTWQILPKYSLIAWLSLALIVLDKPPYIFLVALMGIPLLIEKQYLRSVLFTVISAVSIGIFEILWLSFGNKQSIPSKGHIPAGVSQSKQIHSLVGHPLRMISIPVNTIFHNARFFWESAIGVLGWLDTYLPTWYYFLATFVLAMFVVVRIFSSGFSVIPFLICCAVCVAASFCIFLTLYLIWTPVGLSFVQGVQGRYFLLLLPSVAVCISLRKDRRDRFLGLWILLLLVFIFITQIVVTTNLLQRFWI